MPRKRSNGSDDAQVEILREIWKEMKALKASFESQLEATRRELGAHIEQTNERLDAVRGELKLELGGVRQRMTESELRLATATSQLGLDVRDLSELIREWKAEHRVDREELRGRLVKIERHLGFDGGR